MSDEVQFEVRDRVAYITLNRPERRNALSNDVVAELTNLFIRVAGDDGIWAALLTGAGDKAFCAGADLKELDDMAQKGIPLVPPMFGPARTLFEVMLETYKPVVAAINGPAIAGGCELALSCDLRVAADHAYIGLSEAKRGMGANFGSVVLPRLVPRAIAMQMLYTAEPLSAAEALRWGLYNDVVPHEQLAPKSEELVRQIVANAPLTLRRYKEVSIKSWDMSVHAALRLNVGPNPYLSEDRVEGVRAFVEKRPPQWKGR